MLGPTFPRPNRDQTPVWPVTATTTAVDPPASITPRREQLLPLTVLIAGLLVFAAFAVACRMLYDQTEDRLLQERVDEVAAVLSVSVGQIRTPLDAAATLAQVTDGDPEAFEQAMQAYVGEEQSFSAAALYAIDSTTPIATIGSISLNPSDEAQLAEVLAAARATPFVIVDLLDSGRRLGLRRHRRRREPALSGLRRTDAQCRPQRPAPQRRAVRRISTMRSTSATPRSTRSCSRPACATCPSTDDGP